MLVDTHCHLYFDAFDADRATLLGSLAQRGLAGAIIVALDEPTTVQAHALADGQPGLRFSAGLHPSCQLPDGGGSDWIRPWIVQRGAIAVGECGLELKRPENPLQLQQQAFKHQLLLGREFGLPVIVHARCADLETCQVVEEVPGVRCVFHCFDGGPRMLELALRDGHFVSFAGNLTYPKADELRRAAQAVPLHQLLVETDAPFLAPQPVRGQRCEPAHVAHTARELARLRGMPLTAMAEQLYANACRCFNTSWD